MKKFSEKLHELADHVSKLEKKVTAAEEQNEEKVEAEVNTSKANAKVRQDEFKAKVGEGKEAAASQWEELQTNYNRQVAQIKSNIEDKKETFQLNRAVERAEDAEVLAAISIDFALMAIDDAEISVLEAIEARAYSDALAKTKTTA